MRESRDAARQFFVMSPISLALLITLAAPPPGPAQPLVPTIKVSPQGKQLRKSKWPPGLRKNKAVLQAYPGGKVDLPKMSFDITKPGKDSLFYTVVDVFAMSTLRNQQKLQLNGKGALYLSFNVAWLDGHDLRVSCDGRFNHDVNVSVITMGSETTEHGKATLSGNAKTFTAQFATTDLSTDHKTGAVAITYGASNRLWKIERCSLEKVDPSA